MASRTGSKYEHKHYPHIVQTPKFARALCAQFLANSQMAEVVEFVDREGVGGKIDGWMSKIESEVAAAIFLAT